MDAAEFYSGIVVDAYVRLKATVFAAAPYEQFVRAHGQPGLEIGCGDGEPLLELCAAGLDVDGVDSSSDMVERCSQNAARLGLDVTIHHQRVEELDLERRYRSIYFAGPTFNLLPDDQTARRALERIRTHLREDGVALVPLWIPDPTPSTELGVVRETRNEDGALLRYTPVSETYDRQLRTRTTTTRYEKGTSASMVGVERQWILHWHTPDGFVRLCAAAGLAVQQLTDDDTGSGATAGSVAFTATVRRG